MADEEPRTKISFRLNGKPVSAGVPARLNLVDLLRTEFRLTGSHVGCEHGVCGACNVMLDGVVVRGCLTLAVQADGRDVVSIEGLTANGQIRDLQDAFVQRNALQCGFCTPGMLLTAAELLARDGTPSREQIREEISGNYCRCTGYQAIVDAIETVVARRNGRECASTAHRDALFDRRISIRGRTRCGWRKAAAPIRTMWCSPTWRTSCFCAARMPMPASCRLMSLRRKPHAA